MQTPELLSLKEMQQVYLELLKEFDALCREHDLRYDLAGGSLLGAVRHGGFIPWDDDIDVCMPRPDFRRLLDLKAQGKLSLAKDRDVISHRDKTMARHFGRYVRHDVRGAVNVGDVIFGRNEDKAFYDYFYSRIACYSRLNYDRALSAFALERVS